MKPANIRSAADMRKLLSGATKTTFAEDANSMSERQIAEATLAAVLYRCETCPEEINCHPADEMCFAHGEVMCDDCADMADIPSEARHALASPSARSTPGTGEANVKPMEWRDHRPDSFPEPAWSAQTPFGFYNIEEVSASDSPAYVVKLHAHHFIADKDSLDEAKAAAQKDYETRIRSAIVSPPSLREDVTEARWRDNLQNAWAALRMIREAVGEFGPIADLESEDAVLLRGPEPVHEAEAIVEALGRIRALSISPPKGDAA